MITLHPIVIPESDWVPSFDQLAYKRLKPELDTKYSKGHFIGFHQGEIVVDAPTLDGLIIKMRDLGLDPKKSMVVQAGDDTSDYVDIL